MPASDARDPAAPLAEAPAPPAHLSARAAAEWRRLAPAAAALGTLAEADLRAFEPLAETLATEAEARAVVEGEGHAVPTAGGGQKPRPEVRVMETARVQAARLLAEFGLTPRGRRGLDPPRPRGASDEEDDALLRALLARPPAAGELG
jgi:P27 family predicted phage terminase small subunit